MRGRRGARRSAELLRHDGSVLGGARRRPAPRRDRTSLHGRPGHRRQRRRSVRHPRGPVPPRRPDRRRQLARQPQLARPRRRAGRLDDQVQPAVGAGLPVRRPAAVRGDRQPGWRTDRLRHLRADPPLRQSRRRGRGRQRRAARLAHGADLDARCLPVDAWSTRRRSSARPQARRSRWRRFRRASPYAAEIRTCTSGSSPGSPSRWARPTCTASAPTARRSSTRRASRTSSTSPGARAARSTCSS